MKISGLLFRLLLGFVPLIVYVAVEAVWGTTAGLIAGVSIGIAEFLIVLVRQKRVDWFVLLDTALLIILGLLSLGSDDGLFFRLKPALLDIVLVGLLAFSLLGPRNVVLGMMLRNLDDTARGQIERAEETLKPVLWGLLGVLSAHALATVAVAVWSGEAEWIFVSGPVLYILCGIWFVFELVRLNVRRARLRKTSIGLPGEEILPVVDDEGKIIGKAARSVCHKAPGLQHPVVRLVVYDAAGRILLQKRAPGKESWPNAWDCSASGHISFGETLEVSIARECSEETGLHIDPATARFVFTTRYKTEDRSEHAGLGNVDKELAFLFSVKISDQEKRTLAPQESEVSELRWVLPKNLRAELGSDALICPNLLRDLDAIKNQLSKLPK